MRRFATAVFLSVSLAHAGAIIGQWDGDGKAILTDNGNISWNYANTSYTYSTNLVHSLMAGYGATIGPDAPITAANLAGYDSFVIRIPAAAPTSGEISALSDWVSAGGLLLMFADSSMSTDPFNVILAGIGSTMAMGGTVNQNFFYTPGLFLTNGIVDSWVSPTVGIGVVGGTSLTRGGATWTTAQQAQAAAYIHFQQMGLGYVVVFADTIDVNYVLNANGSALDRMFQNIAGYSNPHGATSTPVTSDIPEPRNVLLMCVGLATVVFFRRALH